MMRWSHFRKGMVCMMLASFMGISTACYGPFNLTKNVYQWNSGIKGSGEVSEKWMKVTRAHAARGEVGRDIVSRNGSSPC